MLLDDTPNRVYVHNLDAELENIEQEEERLIFLPDIERKLRNLPKSVLVGDSHPSTLGKQMILYRVPESLSLPPEKDGVRKAILESRARAAAKQVKEAKQEETPLSGDSARQIGQPNGQTNHIVGSVRRSNDEDDDAMDLG